MVQVVRVTHVVRVVQVIDFVNVYGLHGLNNQIIEKTCVITPVTHKLTNWHGKIAVFCLGRIRN